MKNVMWIQSDGKTSDDFYFMDGTLINDCSQKVEAERVLSKMEKLGQLCMWNKARIRKQLSSPNFTLSYIPGKGFFYKSIFNELASDGRLASFVAFFEDSQAKTIWEILSNNASAVGRSLRLSEKLFLEEFIAKKLSSARYILSSIILLIFITALLIWK